MGVTETLRILLAIFLSTACIQNVRLFGVYDVRWPFLAEIHTSSVSRVLGRCGACDPTGCVSPKLIATFHDVQFSCAINQPLLAHHWMAHQCLLTSRFVAPSIPWGVSAPGGKMRKQLLKDHNFLNNSPIFIIESSTFNILPFKKHCIQYISIWKIVLDLVRGRPTWHHNFMAGCGSLLWGDTCMQPLKWD